MYCENEKLVKIYFNDMDVWKYVYLLIFRLYIKPLPFLQYFGNILRSLFSPFLRMICFPLNAPKITLAHAYLSITLIFPFSDAYLSIALFSQQLAAILLIFQHLASLLQLRVSLIFSDSLSALLTLPNPFYLNHLVQRILPLFTPSVYPYLIYPLCRSLATSASRTTSQRIKLPKLLLYFLPFLNTPSIWFTQIFSTTGSQEVAILNLPRPL